MLHIGNVLLNTATDGVTTTISSQFGEFVRTNSGNTSTSSHLSSQLKIFQSNKVSFPKRRRFRTRSLQISSIMSLHVSIILKLQISQSSCLQLPRLSPRPRTQPSKLLSRPLKQSRSTAIQLILSSSSSANSLHALQSYQRLMIKPFQSTLSQFSILSQSSNSTKQIPLFHASLPT